MMDIGVIKDFISSLSRISELSFEIWDDEGSVFSCRADSMGLRFLNEVRDFSETVMSRGSFQHALSKDGYTIFGVPIRNGAGIIGSLITYDSKTDNAIIRGSRPMQEATDHKEIKTLLASLAAIMEDRWIAHKEVEEMAEEMNQSFEELYLYSKIATQIKTMKYRDTIQKDLIEDLLRVMRVDLAFAELPRHDEYNMIALRPSLSNKIPNPNEFAKNLLNSIPKESLMPNNSYFILDDSRKNPEFRDIHTDPFRFLAVKMQNNKDLHGWLGLFSFNLKEIFRQSELSLLITMAEQIAVVISNAELYHDLERFVINVVKSLVYAIEAKDEYTRGHSERVNSYCMMMAKRLDLGPEGKEVLHWASILHDIGKIGIPESILNKPGRLTDDEYGFIKRHPQKGYEILKPIEQLQSSLEGILSHHERYDGMGYPLGLKGDEIPLVGRIIAVADTFDAITSDRAYRSAKSSEEAMAILEEVAGSQLDPEFVKTFKEIVKESMNLQSEVKHAQ